MEDNENLPRVSGMSGDCCFGNPDNCEPMRLSE